MLELWLIHPSALAGAVEIGNDAFVIALQTQVKALSIYVAVGFVKRDGSNLFNAAVLIYPIKEILIHHRKINELDFARELCSTGSQVAVADTPLGTIGLMICADALSETDRVTERLVAMGADFILSPSAWAVPPEQDNELTPYGSLWVDNYTRGMGNISTWIVAISNVGPVLEGTWAGHFCIGNSIAIGPNPEDLVVSPFGADADAENLNVIDL
jgi:predicted amidohydrolase